MLNAAGIETRIIPDPMEHIWSKFVLNCAINPLTAVTGLRSGEMYRTAEVNALQDRIIDEILAVVERKGIRLAEPAARKKIKDHCRVRYNRPSMMQHVEQGRRTEIDALNGALVREAKALGIAVPYNEAIVAVVKGLERSRRQLLHEPPRDYAKLEAQAEAEARAEAADSPALDERDASALGPAPAPSAPTRPCGRLVGGSSAGVAGPLFPLADLRHHPTDDLARLQLVEGAADLGQRAFLDRYARQLAGAG